MAAFSKRSFLSSIVNVIVSLSGDTITPVNIVSMDMLFITIRCYEIFISILFILHSIYIILFLTEHIILDIFFGGNDRFLAFS